MEARLSRGSTKAVKLKLTAADCCLQLVALLLSSAFFWGGGLQFSDVGTVDDVEVPLASETTAAERQFTRGGCCTPAVVLPSCLGCDIISDPGRDRSLGGCCTSEVQELKLRRAAAYFDSWMSARSSSDRDHCWEVERSVVWIALFATSCPL